MFAAGQYAGAVWAADDDIDILFQRFRHQALQGAFVIQQAVAAGQQEGIRFRLIKRQRQFARLDAVDPEAPGFDHAFVTQAGQCAEGAGTGDIELFQPAVAVEILSDVVDPDDIQTVGLRRFRLCSMERSVPSSE